MPEETVENPQQTTETPEAQPVATAPDWYSSLPPEYQGDKSLEAFKGKPLTEVVKSFIETKKFVGSGLHAPKDDATPEEKQKFVNEGLKLLGWTPPETPEGYKVDRPQLDIGVQWDESLETWFKTTAHSLGMTNAQVQQLINGWGSLMNSNTNQMREAMTARRGELIKEWGETGVKKAEELSRRYFAKYYGNGWEKPWEEHYKYDLTLLPVFARSGEDLVGAGHIDGRIEGIPGKSEAEAEMAKMNENMGSKDNALWNSNHQNHKQAVARRGQLIKIIGGYK